MGINLSLAFILGWVEGVTEFLPVSSTGHLILAGHLLHFTGPKASVFEVFIQIGAIFAVIAAYPQRFLGFFDFKGRQGFSGMNAFILLGCTTLPALAVGFLVHDFVKERLFNPWTVAAALIAGGIWIIVMENRSPAVKKESLDELNWKDALVIGLFQCLAIWPGMSRSAATILGALMIGIGRRAAAEYSFFAAVPVLCAAALLDLVKSLHSLAPADFPFFGLGLAVSFITAWIVIKLFIGMVSRFKMTAFGWYRIVLAAVILLWLR